MAKAGIAFFWFFLESAFLKAQHCLDKMKLSWRSSSLAGFGQPFSLNVADIWSMMIQQTVPKASVSWAPFENCPCLTAMAKAPMILFCWDPVKGSRKMSCTRLMDARFFVKQCQDQRFLCVLPVTALSWVVSAATRSAMSWFLWAEVLFENAVEAVSGKIHEELGLFYCWCDQNHRKGCRQYCFCFQKPTVSILWCLLQERGWLNVSNLKLHPTYSVPGIRPDARCVSKVRPRLDRQRADMVSCHISALMQDCWSQCRTEHSYIHV